MTAVEWVLEFAITAGAAVLGFIAGQVVSWRRNPASFLVVAPTIRITDHTKRLGAMFVALLAVVTVASSIMTSLEVERNTVETAKQAEAQRKCSLHLSERLAARAAISEADHENTTRFIEELRAAVYPQDSITSSQQVIEVADRYLERQDALAEVKEDTPIDAHACR